MPRLQDPDKYPELDALLSSIEDSLAAPLEYLSHQRKQMDEATRDKAEKLVKVWIVYQVLRV